MHSKISKKWRKKWDKDDSKRTFTTDTIEKLVKKENLVTLEENEEPLEYLGSPMTKSIANESIGLFRA